MKQTENWVLLMLGTMMWGLIVGVFFGYVWNKALITHDTLSFIQDSKTAIMQQKVEQLVATKNELDKIIAEKHLLEAKVKLVGNKQ